MITYDELNKQNHHITELSNILSYLLRNRSMCDTESCCGLFYSYVNLVQEHIKMVDQNMYSELLKSPDEKINNVARNFMSGSVEIKKILKGFTRRWCATRSKDALKIKDHKLFLEETNELFDLVLQRILDETEHLYPLVRSLA